jgi:hypothetical protein
MTWNETRATAAGYAAQDLPSVATIRVMLQRCGASPAMRLRLGEALWEAQRLQRAESQRLQHEPKPATPATDACVTENEPRKQGSPGAR